MDSTAEISVPYRAARFFLDGTVDQPVVGYTDGSRWNGWATPVFDKETATQIMRAVNDTNADVDDQINVIYDAERDAFLIHDPNYPDEEPEQAAGYDIVVDGRRRHVYRLGTCSWTWETTE